MKAHVTVDGIRLCYRERGEGPGVLFLHGWGASSKFWRGTQRTFRRAYRTVALDLCGFGRSDKPENGYSICHQAALVARCIESLGLAPVHVVGHSMGGMVALKLAAIHPELVRGLVLVGTPVQGERGLTLRASLASAVPFKRFFFLFRKSPALVQFIINNFTYMGRLPRELLLDARHLPVHSLYRSVLAIRGADLTEDLPRVRVPTLVVHAARDALVRPEAADLAVSRVKGARLVRFEGVGHCPMLERPKEFNQVLRGFLDETSGLATARRRDSARGRKVG
ncbi:MAG: alpha/beta hydrolase [Planctomycetes bacterium]|nr:alpha/beta hydrolase [Planctomycetota bacterium]